MSNYLAGRRVAISYKAACRRIGLANWSIHLARRVSRMKKPGQYTLQLIVRPDGRRQLMTHDGKIEELGIHLES